MSQPKTSSKSKSSKSDASKVHKLALKGSSKIVNEFVSAPTKQPNLRPGANCFQFEYCINTILCVSPHLVNRWSLLFIGSSEVYTQQRTSRRKKTFLIYSTNHG
jgi:hypothetical protein